MLIERDEAILLGYCLLGMRVYKLYWYGSHHEIM